MMIPIQTELQFSAYTTNGIHQSGGSQLYTGVVTKSPFTLKNDLWDNFQFIKWYNLSVIINRAYVKTIMFSWRQSMQTAKWLTSRQTYGSLCFSS